MKTNMLFILTLILLGGCEECDGDLSGSCSNLDQSCVLNNDGSWNIAEESSLVFNANSSCRVGKTVCNEKTTEVYCAGFVGPTKEVCDGFDNNCNGQVDEELTYEVDHPKNDCKLLGACTEAKKACYSGRYQCVSPNGPTVEVCDNVDNDCDGTIDNIFQEGCWEGRGNADFSPGSQCQMGVTSCLNGNPTCAGQVLPTPEICDGVDNNCNGQVDDNLPTSGLLCGPSTALGQCSFGTTICGEGETYCLNAVYPQTESCDNIDNDCDGVIDDNLFKPCSSICGPGVSQCNRGEWGDCSSPQPTIELCDGLDNDCDGEVDEGCFCTHGAVETCTAEITDNGVLLERQCGLGLKTCESGLWGDCEFWKTFPEVCNKWDDDCDGEIDNFSKSCGNPEFDGVGICSSGEKTCTDGEWSECTGEVTPTFETCNNLDDNCDGEVDENINGHGEVDLCFIIDISSSMGPYITALRSALSQYASEFENTDHLFCLITYPNRVGEEDNDLVITNPPLSPVSNFITALSGVSANGGGIEPTYDVLYDAASSNDPMGIGWRPDATPYIILITDETPQTLQGLNEQLVSNKTSNCRIGECEGGQMEVFVISDPSFQYEYNSILGDDLSRYFEIHPGDDSRYLDILNSIFREVCVF